MGTKVAEATKTVGGKSYPAGDFLVVEDPESPNTWHLQVRRNGTPDHNLMGAAWAALHGGYRGNTYAGPGKAAALRKLRGLYRTEKMDLPAEAEPQDDADLSEDDWGEEVAVSWPAPYVPSGVYTFADMDLARQAQEYQHTVQGLVGGFMSLFNNVMFAYSLDGGDTQATMNEKMTAARALLDELGQRVAQADTDAQSTEVGESEPVQLSEVSVAEQWTGNIVKVIEGPHPENRRGPLKLEVALITPGWGNRKDNYYYAREMLDANIDVFKGAKMYATDHKATEKSVSTEMSIVLDPAYRKGQHGEQVALVGVHNPDFAEMVRNREELGTLGDLHCSILANAVARNGFELGGRRGKYVEAITEALAVDWVTRAGAGGHAERIVAEHQEGTGDMGTKTEHEDVQDVAAEGAVAEGQPESVVVGEAAAQTPAAPADVTPPAAPEPQPEQAAEAQPAAPVTVAEARVGELLASSKLPAEIVEMLKRIPYATETEVAEAAAKMLATFRAAVGAGQVRGLGEGAAPTQQVTAEERDKRLDDLWRRHGITAPGDRMPKD